MLPTVSSRPAQRRPTISDVAKLANVSISTVSRVLNASAPVAEETVQQVCKAIEALEYVPSAAARSLAGRRTATIGLYLPRTSGAFFASLLQGIEAGVRENGYDLLIHADPRVARDGQLADLSLGEHNADGLLIFTDCLSEAGILRLHARGYPLLLLFRSAPANAKIPCVNLENKAGARQIIDHLIEVHGCRRIAWLRGPAGNEDSAWREKGYLESLVAHGIPLDPDLIGEGNFAAEDAQRTVKEWLRRGLSFDAIFAGDDDAASGVMIALRQAGLSIPGDIAVVGFDDVSYAAALTPPLTTVQVPIETAGLEAARQLVSLIQTGSAELHTLLPNKLVIRQSCGCPEQAKGGDLLS